MNQTYFHNAIKLLKKYKALQFMYMYNNFIQDFSRFSLETARKQIRKYKRMRLELKHCNK